MLTIAESEIFGRYVTDYWTEDERGEFAVWIAEHYDASDVIPGSGGCRKVRWSRKGTGKKGGVRVIYYNMLVDGTIWLLLMGTTINPHFIPTAALREKFLAHISNICSATKFFPRLAFGRTLNL